MVDGPPETAGHETDRSWAAMLADLPADLDGSRLLEVVVPGTQGSAAGALAGRGEAEIVVSDQPADLPGEVEAGFGFVICRDALRATPYPMALLADLWRLTAPGGVLLLDSEVLPGADHSGYARFVPTARAGAGWVPGRLTLRWVVEASGFDVEHWLGEPGAATDSRACLRAIRGEREPVRSAP